MKTVHLALALTALSMLACGSSPRESDDEDGDGDAPGPTYAGYWTGTLGGRDFAFHVDENGILDSLIATVRIDLGQGEACIGPFKADETADVRNGGFDLPVSFPGGSVRTRITGSFGSATAASGSLASVRGSSVSLACGSTYTVVSSSASWTIVASASWSAAPGAGTCRWPGDGECDERAGTGLCLEGTDTADCQ